MQLPEKEVPVFISSIVDVPKSTYGYGVNFDPVKSRWYYAYWKTDHWTFLRAHGTHKTAQIHFRRAYLEALSEVITLCNELKMYEYSTRLLGLFTVTEQELRDLMSQGEDDD